MSVIEHDRQTHAVRANNESSVRDIVNSILNVVHSYSLKYCTSCSGELLGEWLGKERGRTEVV